MRDKIEKIRNGDVGEFTLLVKQYQNLAFAYAYSMLGDFHRSQDIVQEAFITSYYQIDKLQKPEAFPAWLKGIVRNHCLHQLRGKKNQWENLDALENVGSHEINQEESLSQNQEQEILLRSIQSLPEYQRRVISLFYIEENSQKDVAGFLGISISDVNNSLHSARKTLRGKIENMVEQTFKSKALSAEFAEGIGKILKINGRLVDAVLDPTFKPVLFDDLKSGKKAESKLTVVQRLKNGYVRCIAYGGTDIKAHAKVEVSSVRTHQSMSEDLIKEAISIIGPKKEKKLDIFETGIKVIDLLCPFPKNGTVGLFGDSGTGRSALVAEMYKRFPTDKNQLSMYFLVGTGEASSVASMIENEPDLNLDEGGRFKLLG